MTPDLTGARAIVTGAGRGIGRAVALSFAAAGADVAVLDLAPSPRADEVDSARQSTAQEVAGRGRRSLEVAVDLSDEVATHAAINSVINEWDGLDILVNIAGGAVTPFATSAPSKISSADIRTCLDVNLMSAIFSCQAAVPALAASSGQGRQTAIVNTSSLSATGVLPAGMLSGYALSKAALVHYTRSLAEEVGPSGIRVNAVAPGYIMTDRVRANSADTGFADKAADSALRRLGEPQDIADAVVYLASPMAGYITGQVLAVDGATRLV
jgi:NAD(P)-dependent dehydrogenase (short-subunit alcohol dehydrogenase family)